MTPWIIVAALSVMLLLFIALYNRALSETRGVSFLFIMTLLNEDAYRQKKESLIDLVRATSAKNAWELGFPVRRALTEMGWGMRNSRPGVYGNLWKLKQEISQSEI